MPKNPFGQDDPLSGGGGGAWGGAAGAGAGGFGSNAPREEVYAANDGEEYDVVDIAEPGSNAPAVGSKNGSKASFASKGDNTSKSLAARELALKKREEDLARREAQLNRNAAGFNPLMVKNWPKCYPIVHHDISNDIPEGKRGITRAGFFIFLMTFTALWYNLVAVIIACTAGPVKNVAAAVIFAIIYVVVGIPGAWILWYQRLYKGMISDGAVSFATFFCVFMIHIAFCVWSAIAPEIGNINGTGHAGLLPAIEFMNGGGADKLSGILYFVSAGIWGFLAFISFLYLFRVYKFFRTSGVEEAAREQVRNEAARQGRNEAVRQARL